MIGELVVMGLIVVAVVLVAYLVTREPKDVKAKMPPVMASVKPERGLLEVPRSAPVYKAGKASQVKSSSGRSQVPSGGSSVGPTHHDTSSSDLLTTMLILDAMDTSDNYVAPSVDTYSTPSYSSPTPSSYSSSDDSCSRSSYSDSSSYSSYSSSDSSSSYSDSSSSSSSSSCD